MSCVCARVRVCVRVRITEAQPNAGHRPRSGPATTWGARERGGSAGGTVTCIYPKVLGKNPIVEGGGRMRHGQAPPALPSRPQTDSTTEEKCKNKHQFSLNYHLQKMWFPALAVFPPGLQEEEWKKEAIKVNLSPPFNPSACRKGKVSNSVSFSPI